MTLKEFYIIAYLQIALYATVALFSFIHFKKRDKYVKIVGLLFSLSLVCDILMFLFLPMKINPNYVASLYNVIALPIMSYLYYLATGQEKKNLFFLISLLYSLFGIVNVLAFQKEAINSYTSSVLSIIILIYCLYYFYWLLKELPTMHLHRLPMFWINSAFMVYHAGNLFLYVFTSYLVNVLKDNLLIYWSLHNFLGMIEMSMIIFALWIDLKMIKSKTS